MSSMIRIDTIQMYLEILKDEVSIEHLKKMSRSIDIDIEEIEKGLRYMKNLSNIVKKRIDTFGIV